MLETVEINTSKNAKYSIIWLHGLGADGHDFESVVPELRLPNNDQIHFVFPHAKVRPVSINAGYRMRAWYDIYEIAIDRKVDEVAIDESKRDVEALIQREIDAGIDEGNILLAGFSQGGVIALYTALSSKYKLAGLIGLSCYLVKSMLSLNSNKKEEFPIFIGHGTQDPVVPYHLGEEIEHLLMKSFKAMEFHSYPMQHSLCLEEINDLSKFIQKVFHLND